MMLMVMSIGMNVVCLYADDTDLFMIQVPPDVLIILDLSGSMDWTPAGSTLYIGSDDGDESNDYLVDCGIDGPFYSKSGPGHTKPCYGLSQDFGPKYGDSACNGPFYKASGTGHTLNCSRVAIAKRAIFDILDNNDSGGINSQDETSLGVRFGYMRFYGCGSDTGAD